MSTDESSAAGSTPAADDALSQPRPLANGRFPETRVGGSLPEALADGRRAGDPEPWVLLDEKPGFDGFLTVRLRRYRLPDGREVDWDVFGPRLSAGITAGITVLPLTPEGRIVTVRTFRAGPDQIVTNLPGGLIDPGEEPDVAGRRELEEETGYTCESLEVVGWHWSSASSVYRKYVAIARDCRPDGEQHLDEYEDCVPVELTVEEFRQELRTPGAMTGTDAAYLALDHAGLL